ncbi:DUF6786 family protein [Phycisphaerales bacterium AB-hyl4]|uniref:DUF6786 family protein n=1 Tax=Natronomicrosphaera hydrolytica TaxID=3242702 RepID=A0ABV4U5D6_9BACT
MADWLNRLAASLADNGHEPRTFTAGSGQIIVLDHGARVLGCTLPGVDENLFWHNPRLEDASDAGTPLHEAGGLIGGDRIWIAPENGYMWPDLEAARTDPQGTYQLPTRMDPSEWGPIEEGDDHVVLGTTMALTDHRSERSVSLNLSREITIIDRPHGLPDSLACASFAIRNDLSLIEGDPEAVAGAWDILQLPPTGTLICPTVMPVQGQPRSYYDPFGDKHVQVDPHCVRFLIDSRRRIKMGLRAEHTNGRMGYYRALPDGQASLIVRVFLPQPGEAYVDMPRMTDDTFGGDALQAYNDDGTATGEGPGHCFGEMEYHDPAIVVGAGPALRTGSCVTHVIAGAEGLVRQAGRMLLGVDVQPIA